MREGGEGWGREGQGGMMEQHWAVGCLSEWGQCAVRKRHLIGRQVVLCLLARPLLVLLNTITTAAAA